MTSLAQVTALVDAHVSRDFARFRAITLQIAAQVRSPQGAEQLRRLVDRQQAVSFAPLPSVGGLLSAASVCASLEDMVLSSTVRDGLDRVLVEHAQRDVLMARGLRPARKLLFMGAPGTGKTMAAGAISCAVGLPLFRIELHAVIASHLGETSSNLAKIFEHVRSMPAVYLFDEFDALGADRSVSSDGSAAGAETRRIVNTLLQLIEDDRSEGFIIAATNHPRMLDRAVFRRFDEAVMFPVLTREEVVVLVDRALVDFDVAFLDYDAICGAAPFLGHADLCAVLDRVRKDHVILGTSIDTGRIVGGIQRRLGPREVPDAQ